MTGPGPQGVVIPLAFDQARFDIRCEWGEHGVQELAADSDAVIIVDVLSFSTCVDVATSRGATVYPYRWHDSSAREYAAKMRAELAGPRSAGGPSLRPVSMLSIGPGSRVVLPSPNGSTLSLATGETPTFAGCLRNAAAVGQGARELGPRVALIPAGERWPDGRIRASLEDWLGAGAIIAQLEGSKSPEARAAEASFRAAEQDLEGTLRDTGSGQEMMEFGYAEDIGLASQLSVSECIPRLIDSAFMNLVAT
jgi:2-phosphosulfolactate phosphatase